MPRAAGLVALVALTAANETTRAAPVEAPREPGIVVEVVGSCPDADAVQRALAGILSTEEAAGVSLSVQDQGAHYRIVVREAATTLADPGRACAARARQAAVVIAAELRTHPVVLGPPIWTIEKGLVFDVAPGTRGPAWAPGAEIRGALGSGRWSLVGAAGARGAAAPSFEGGWEAGVLRVPPDPGARGTAPWGGVRPRAVLRRVGAPAPHPREGLPA